MLLELGKIINCPGESVSFSAVVDLSDLKYGNSYPVSQPVKADGFVRNTAGVLEMTGSIKTCIHGVCDRCGSTLVQRKDDMPETVQDRLKVYHEQTEPLKGYYEKTGKLRTVEGQEEVADTTKLVLAALEI